MIDITTEIEAIEQAFDGREFRAAVVAALEELVTQLNAEQEET